MKSTPLLLAATFSSLLAGSIISHEARADNLANNSIVSINGIQINEWTLNRYARQRGLPAEMPQAKQREILLEELINRELIYQNAVEIGVDKAPAIQAEIHHQRINIIANSMLNRSSSRFAVSDSELKKEYENRKTELGGKEFKARHILLKKESEAKAVIAELDKGADFATLAGTKSTGPSATNGGDLGWFQRSQMVSAFSDAAAALKKGQYTSAAVQTQFGWHVILLEDNRTVAPPAFDEIKEQIRVGMQGKLMEAYIAGLRKTAKIER
jgi:peptidyl-prolyl cis-trans isomerase C